MTDRPRARIYDMQGTLVDVSSIRHMVEGKEKDFDAFHYATAGCPPHQWVVDAMRKDFLAHICPLVLTGMNAKFRSVVNWWLADNKAPAHLVMTRADGDFRKDFVIKREMYDHLIKYYDIIGAFDDNPAIVELWESLGLPTTVVPGWGATPKEDEK
jgi:hypothetical protein